MRTSGRTSQTQRQPTSNTVGANHLLQRKCACGGTPGVDRECVACRAKRLQREATSAAMPSVAPPIVHEVLNTPGQPLDAATRAFMEPRFGHFRVQGSMPNTTHGALEINQPGDRYEREAESVAAQVTHAPALSAAPTDIGQRGHDFSKVRVHTDARAAEAAQAVGASAFTVGSSIVFANGQYAPHTQQGRSLLAHELVHMIQQTNIQPHVQRSFQGCATLLSDPISKVLSVMGGLVVHKLIQAHFNKTVQGATSVAIRGASAAPLRSEGICGKYKPVIDPQITGGQAGIGFPDLARITAGGILQVAEIKPAAEACLIDGEEQLLRYIDQGNAPDKVQTTWRNSLGVKVVSPMLESGYQPPNIATPVGDIRTAWCSPGLLAYSIRGKKVPVPVLAPAKEKDKEKAEPNAKSAIPDAAMESKLNALEAKLALNQPGGGFGSMTLLGPMNTLNFSVITVKDVLIGLGLAAVSAAAVYGVLVAAPTVLAAVPQLVPLVGTTVLAMLVLQRLNLVPA